MINSFLINTAFLNAVSKLRKHFDNTQVSEIHITPTTIECYNKEGQNVDILFGEDITTIPIKKAQLPLLLEDIRIKNIPNHPLKEIVGDKSCEHSEKRRWNRNSRHFIKEKFTEKAFKYLSVNNYSLLLLKAHKVREEELNMFLGLLAPFAEAQACLKSFAEAQV
ncbi:hypothetical protein C2G38_2180127 [Gigaspora rosea]|uniref:Uncharacterized protein n=1 Tax=Gigaspora rosea TaxID=44941 RepID=A0A397VE44_9GLOM|nr:hypothetical protein C2G38_2180127 [Gigaspora rosea]